MLENYTIGSYSRTDEIYFEMLSDEAKAVALEHAGIKDPRDANWDVLPLAYVAGDVALLDQDDIDLSALAQLGCYAVT